MPGVDQLALVGGEKAFGEGVVQALAGAADRQGDLAVAREGRGPGVPPRYAAARGARGFSRCLGVLTTDAGDATRHRMILM